MSSVLIKALTAADTTLYVSGGDEFFSPDAHLFAPLGGTIVIESEQITYSSYYMGKFEIAARGANSTAAAIHAVGVAVAPIAPYLGDVRVVFMNAAGVPSDGTTGLYFAQKGSLYSDVTNANLYIQVGTLSSPAWKLVTRAS